MKAVIGANFGDEGKGAAVDYLCSRGDADIVVRYNGGAQAGHTVIVRQGLRHVHHHFGSGTLRGVPTFLGRRFVCNPLLFNEEYGELQQLGLAPKVFVDPRCYVTTFVDMLINQTMEKRRGNGRHGSCGVGFGETIERTEQYGYVLTMLDLLYKPKGWLEDLLRKLCTEYALRRLGYGLECYDSAIADFVEQSKVMADVVHPRYPQELHGEIVFEGAQGLLLSQDNAEYFPHVTRSYTGTHNILEMLEEMRQPSERLATYYVTRTYLTRHGAGPFPGEKAEMRFEDNTNLPHPWQGTLRFAPLDTDAMLARCATDAWGTDGPHFIVTHCDQVPPPASVLADFKFHGPIAETVEK